MKYNIFDENNIRRDIYLKKNTLGGNSSEYTCKNVPGSRSSYKSTFILKKNSENNMLWELREIKDQSENILRAINIESGYNPRNIRNQFNMCDRVGDTNEVSCSGNDSRIDDVDIINADHETAPQCADEELNYNDQALHESDFWSCDGLAQSY